MPLAGEVLLHRRLARAFALVWTLVLVMGAVAWLHSDMVLVNLPGFLQSELVRFGRPLAAVIYLLIGAVRPLVLLPASIYVIAGGMLFSPPVAAVLAISGINVGAWVGYGLASWWMPAHGKPQLLSVNWLTYLREKALPAVFAMRLAALPFDLVSIGCGLARVGWRPYALGTLFGALPSLLIILFVMGALNDAGHRYMFLGAALLVVIATVISMRRAGSGR